ncbi:rod-binding protein [Microvirga sp. HBU67558]|uniref:rod-binding protein n=1 Tax=Microvirga TaxID=186650 RepID=UPI001B3587F6|nr:MULTISPECIES: rod-binding protein [unclassified Microvirga]MBQ0824762.1 rod-binding protein [Microvirga sp. HBU67558]
MAISPPSDIVNDVARAADPARYQAAAQKLLDGASAVDGASFEDAVKSVAGQPLMASGADVYTLRISLRNDAESAGAARSKKAHQEFEAYILQTFVESMLPKDAENTYGKGNAGSIWKSMMAEQIGAQISKAGGIGIAQHVLGTRVTGPSSDIPAPRPIPPFSTKI